MGLGLGLLACLALTTWVVLTGRDHWLGWRVGRHLHFVLRRLGRSPAPGMLWQLTEEATAGQAEFVGRFGVPPRFVLLRVGDVESDGHFRCTLVWSMDDPDPDCHWVVAL